MTSFDTHQLNLAVYNLRNKWVNDIYLGTYKVGGIITEAALDLESSSAGNFIMGIGLNLSTKDFPADLSEKAQGINPEFSKSKAASVIIPPTL